MASVRLNYGEDDVKLTRVMTARSFWGFVQTFWDCVPGAAPLVPNWHMRVICDAMQEAAERVFRGLPKARDYVFNVPPGTSKSTICSVMFLPWTWARDPKMRHICASHTSDLVMDLAGKTHALLEHEFYRDCFPHVKLAKDQDAKNHFRNTVGGDRYTCTVAGKSPIGMHAHFHVVDDPIDPKKARSVAELQTAREFMTEVLPSRKVDKAVTPLFLVMQRLRPGDPTDVVLETARKPDACPVHHVCLPAELGDNVSPPELAEKYTDGLMDPHRLPAHVLKIERATMGEYAYAGQYGQRPTLPGGGMFKCLASGTLISTPAGKVPIERVAVGDEVLTRGGARQVRWAGQSDVVDHLTVVEFSDGRLLIGTPGHLVLMQDRGFVRMDSLCPSDVAVVEEGECLDNLLRDGLRDIEESTCASVGAGGPSKSSSTTESVAYLITDKATTSGRSGANSSGSMVLSTSGRRGASISTAKEVAVECSTATFGDISKAPSPVGTMSIMWTGTRVITTSTIYSASATVSILAYMLSQAWEQHERRRSSGTNQPREDESTARSLVGFMLSALNERSSAPCAGGCLLRNRLRGAAAQLAAVIAGGTAAGFPVYDLSVADCPEFYANGVLVHNCHWWKYRKNSPHAAKRVFFVDRAATEGGGCATAGTLMARDNEGNWWVEYVVHGHWEPDERNKVIRAAAERFRRRYGPKYEPTIAVESEGGSSGRDAWKGFARALAGFKVVEVRVTGSKDVRAEPWASQVAAGNVYIVDNGESEGLGVCDWDVQGYVDEHTRFKPDVKVKRLGGMKDRVDSSSGGYNWLVGKPGAGSLPLRRFDFAHRKDRNRPSPPRFLLCTSEELATTVIEHPTLLVHVHDHGAGDQPPPEHGLTNLQGHLSLAFDDLDPALLGNDWDAGPDPAVSRAADRDMLRKLWGFLLQRREPPAACFVFTCRGGDGFARAAGLCHAVCDALGHKRKEVYLTPEGSPDSSSGENAPFNQYVYDLARSARSSVAAR